MKAISLWQPWGSLWLSERKVHETRHWPTAHRGALLVHAAKRFERNLDRDDPLRVILDDEYGGHWGVDLPTGALLGIVNLVECIPTDRLILSDFDKDDVECGDWTPGRFVWRRASAFTKFARPIPWRGAQGMFNVPDDVLPTPEGGGG